MDLKLLKTKIKRYMPAPHGDVLAPRIILFGLLPRNMLLCIFPMHVTPETRR